MMTNFKIAPAAETAGSLMNLNTDMFKNRQIARHTTGGWKKSSIEKKLAYKRQRN